jgi:uncharacterized cupredoxin-like copper-binding protein
VSDDLVDMRSAILAMAALTVVCAGVFAVAGGAANRPADARASTLAVAERDFHIAAPTEVRAGHVTLRVHNKGPDSHELIVIRLAGAALPLRRDGLTVDEDAVEHETAGALEPGQPGATRKLELRLDAGRYELLCNMSGHYMGGMHSILVVR